MDSLSLLVNGRFLYDLSAWNPAGASYSAGNGDAHYGCASMPAASSIHQQFAVDRARSYTLHVAAYGGSATVQIADGNGNSLPSQTASGSAGVWTESTITLGLAPGNSYTITITNAGGSTILVDDVWLWWVPQTRSQLAATVARQIATLAGDASFATTLSGAQTEGDYTDAVDAGLRSVGAIDPESDLPDIRALSGALLAPCLDAIERAMLSKLQRYYARLVDTKAGPVEEKLSQIAAGLASATRSGSGGSGGGQVVVRTLRHVARDYELGQ